MGCRCKRSAATPFRRAVLPALLSCALAGVWLAAADAWGQTIPVVGQPPFGTPGAGLENLGRHPSTTLPFPAATATGGVPPTPGSKTPLAVCTALEPLVRRMWEASPTFRRQWARLDAAVVTMTVGVDSSLNPEAMNAFTTIEARAGRVRRATTRLRIPAPEYVAHEIEHVLEQVDGVDVRWSARHGVDGAEEVQSGVFETARAIAVGRLVAAEVARWRGAP